MLVSLNTLTRLLKLLKYLDLMTKYYQTGDLRYRMYTINYLIDAVYHGED